MLLIRELMYCKPGKVKPLVEKFVTMAKMMEKAGQPRMKVLTDFAGEQYWTIVCEFEVKSIDDFEKMITGEGSSMSKEDLEKMDELMKGYHDLVDHGRREIFRVEY
jgi:hypothetical protein